MTTKIKGIISRLPNVAAEELYEFFPKLEYSGIPQLKGYTWDEWHEGSMGAGDQYLMAEIGQLAQLAPGKKVLELGAGNCFNACFLAKHFGVDVIAVDLHADVSKNWQTIVGKGMDKKVLPLKCDAKHLPLPQNYFDSIVSLNSYLYFGTDDLFLPYIAKFLKPGGQICIVSPCYSQEVNETTPEHFFFDYPDYIESYAMHSPKWWDGHFKKYRNIDILLCKEHNLGREIWLDSIRWQLQSRDIKHFYKDIEMLLRDEERLITYFTLLAQRKS